MNSGWVCFYRKIAKWEWYTTPSMLHLFFHLIVMANHDDGSWQGFKVKRGQLITGRKSLSDATGISEQSIRTCLTRLERTGEITQKSTNRFSIITLCHYNDYQDKKENANQQLTSNQPATNQQLTTNNNENNVTIKQIKDVLVKKFVKPSVEDVATYCTERKNGIDAEYFVDKYSACGWILSNGNKMKDWKATIRTWEKNNFPKKSKIFKTKQSVNDEIQDIGAAINEQTGFNPYRELETGNSSGDAHKDRSALSK